ncbi:hypothetical protein C0992_002682 [Termitomyces sp. T32_za158]|nr:hypothetical protein C0992_002682 [Termitomyces sp. T32_za158]
MQALLATLGQKHSDGASKDWAYHLLDFNNQGVMEQLSEAICKDLQQNAFKCNKLCYFVDEIHTSPNPGTFTNPTDPARSFHIQRGASFNPNDAARIPEWQNQEELNAASPTLCALNPNRGLFKQPAARTIGFSAHQWANMVLSTFRTWGQTVRKKTTAAPPPGPQHNNDARSDGTLCYMDPTHPDQNQHHSTAKGPLMWTYGEPKAATLHSHQNPPRSPTTKDCPNPHRDRRKLWSDLQHPPLTTTILEAHSHPVAGIPDHPLAVQDLRAGDLLAADSREAGAPPWFKPQNPALSNWQSFIDKFSSKFGVFDTVAKAEDNLFNLKMHPKERFTTFIIRFEKEAYKTGWNYSTLQYALCHALPQCIKDVLWLAPKQPSYNGYKALVTQVDQCYWEDRSKYNNAQSQWNPGQLWHVGATIGPNNPHPPNPALPATPCARPPFVRNPGPNNPTPGP